MFISGTKKIIVIVGLMISVLCCWTGPCRSTAVEYGLGLVGETIVGKNSSGPYFLAYSELVDNSIEISVNGALLRLNKDYKIDTAKGIVSFTRVLISGATANVTYKITPGKSTKTSGAFAVPLNMNVVETNSAKVKILGNYTSTSDSGTSVIGLGSENKIGSTDVTSMILTSRVNGSGSSQTNANMKDQSLYKVGMNTSSGRLNISGSILKSGKDFSAASAYGATLGKNSENAAMAYNLGQYGDFNVLYQNQQDSAGNAAGTYSSNLQQNLNIKPTDGTAVAIGHSQAVSGNQSNETTVETTGVKVDQKLGQIGNAAASVQQVETTTAAGKQKVDTAQVAVNGGNDKVQVSANAVQKNFSDKESENAVSVSANAKASDKVGVNVGIATAQNDQVGKQTSSSVKVNASNVGKANVEASHSETDSTLLGQSTQTNIGVKTDNVGVGVGMATAQNDTVGDQKVTDVKVDVKNGSILSVNASASQTESTKLGETLQHSVSVSAAPVNNMNIVGSLTGRETADTKQSQKDFALTSKPVKYALFTASYQEKNLNDNSDVTKAGTLDLTPLAYARFGLGWKSIDSGGTITTITDYSTSASPLQYLSLSGKLRQRQLASGNIDTHALDLTLGSASFMSLEGTYRYNPEDDKGNIQSQRNMGLGLRTNLGRLGFYGGYTQKNQYLISQINEEHNFNLDYSLDGYSRLTAGFQASRLMNGTDSGTNIYQFGYSRKIGSGFDFLLSSKYTRYIENSAVMPDKDDVKAEASLSMQF